MKHATFVQTTYKSIPCPASNSYIKDHNIECFDPREIDKDQMVTKTGLTYNYIKNPSDSVGLNVAAGSFDNSGNFFSLV
ncbi:MAG: hypothetical protein EOO43_18845 [Flavobacterium sp.]|nr:MAG: hypothetical protein EOO43_18845 [Flavobacterium sp.]